MGDYNHRPQERVGRGLGFQPHLGGRCRRPKAWSTYRPVSHQFSYRNALLISRHISTTNPTHPAPPSEQLAANAKQVNSTTASIAESAESGAKKVGQYVHDKAQQNAHYLPESVQRLGDPVAEQDKGELRKLAETGWTQATFAAKGLVGAATTIAGAVSQNAHRAVEHNFGKEADGVAQG